MSIVVSMKQHGDDEQETHGIAIAGRDIACAQLLDRREYEAADGRARDAAQTPEDHDRESFERGEVAHRRRDDEHRAEKGACGCGEARAERERRGVDRADIDAHKGRRIAILERRPHGFAELRAVYQKVGRDDEKRSRCKNKYTKPRDRHGTERKRLGWQR